MWRRNDQMKKPLVMATFLVSIVVLGSCGSEATPTPPPTATGTPLPTPTSTPSPEPTATPTATPTPIPGPEEVNDAYLVAFNAGDVEMLRGLYADDVVFTLGNLPYGPGGQPTTDSYTGKGAVIAEHFQSVEANARITLANTNVEGNTLRGEFSYGDDRSDLDGIQPLTGAWETVVEDGKITSLTMTFDDETHQKWKTAVALASTPLPPIIVAEGTVRKDVQSQLPVAEVECMRQSLGETAFAQFSRSDFSQDASEAEEEALSRCLGNESLSRFFVGFAVSETGGLSDDTIACMSHRLSGHDLHAIFFNETAWGEAFQAMTGCFSADERARAEAGGTFQGPTRERQRAARDLSTWATITYTSHAKVKAALRW